MTEEDERRWIKGMRTHPNELLLVAVTDGKIIGNLNFSCGSRKRTEHAGEFGLGLLPEWRGQGIGLRLLSTLIDWATNHPTVEKIRLKVLASNVRAIAVYKKLGFREEGCLVREIKYGDGVYVDDLQMALFVKG